MAQTLPLVICILDGWGEAPPSAHNAVASARTPAFDYLRNTYPHGVIQASEHHVGLPAHQMGNSEVGHMNLGAGRVVMQDLPRIDAAIASGELAQHPHMRAHIAALKASGGTCHLIGLASDGGVHAHLNHMLAVAGYVAGAGVPVAIHAVLDGRDTRPKSAEVFLRSIENAASHHGNIHLASICGRFYAMDRDKRWDRVQQAYDLWVHGSGARANSVLQALEDAYDNGVTDEFIAPTALGDFAGMQDGDGLFVANFRADRVRQFLHALTDDAFAHFVRSKAVKFSHVLGMVRYSDALANIPAVFEPQTLTHTLGEVVAAHNLRQLRIAETEKYAHVTFFFNGGREEVFAQESRIMVPSPKVATYDLQPEMSADEVTNHVVAAIENATHDVIIVNYANTDMVGHSGNFSAAVKAVEAVDSCIARITLALEKAGGAMLLTADHGNAECMHDEQSKQAHTQHTLNVVPFVALHPKLKHVQQNLPVGTLADIAPTALYVLGIAAPQVMTGKNLLQEYLQ